MTGNLRTFRLGAILLMVALLGLVPLVRMGSFALSAFKPGSTEALIIEVHKGQSPNDLTKLLTTSGIVSDGKSFIWLGRLGRQWRRIKAGEYQVSPSMTPIEIFSTLTSGISITYPTTIREGE